MGIKFHCKNLNLFKLGVNLHLAVVVWWGSSDPSPKDGDDKHSRCSVCVKD